MKSHRYPKLGCMRSLDDDDMAVERSLNMAHARLRSAEEGREVGRSRLAKVRRKVSPSFPSTAELLLQTLHLIDTKKKIQSHAQWRR